MRLRRSCRGSAGGRGLGGRAKPAASLLMAREQPAARPLAKPRGLLPFLAFLCCTGQPSGPHGQPAALPFKSPLNKTSNRNSFLSLHRSTRSSPWTTCCSSPRAPPSSSRARAPAQPTSCERGSVFVWGLGIGWAGKAVSTATAGASLPLLPLPAPLRVLLLLGTSRAASPVPLPHWRLHVRRRLARSLRARLDALPGDWQASGACRARTICMSMLGCAALLGGRACWGAACGRTCPLATLRVLPCTADFPRH